jgi:DNA/RNA endonuclease YhcR with UshA esterase domain
MKKLLFFLIISFLLSGCGKKKEEVIVTKNNEQETAKIEETSKENTTGLEKETKSENKTAGEKPEKENRSTEVYTKLKTSETAGKIGFNAYVTGYVAEVNVREKVAYLNFDSKYPNNTFTAVIFPDKYELFGDLNKYRNKTVEIKGRIGQYKGKPQIILNSREQIKTISN